MEFILTGPSGLGNEMALPIYALKHIAKYLKPNSNVAMLSYQDIIANPHTVMSVFGMGYQSDIKYRQDSDKIVEWHKASNITQHVVDTRWLFESLGHQIDFFDITKARGEEIFLDLNFNLPIKHRYQYDFVFENTLQHVFNIGIAMSNVFQLCKKGGIIMHLNPLNLINSGFYSISPTLYKDFYEENDSEILHYESFTGIHIQKDFLRSGKEDMMVRPASLTEKAMQLCIAQRNRPERTGVKIPTQTKFKSHPESKL